ncbi:MAG TPA: class I SAM-dependent methyltransferase, partial [Candidatus Limnocylindrales bacterium]
MNDRRARGPDDERLSAELVAAWDRDASTYDATPRQGILHEDEWRAWRRLLAALLGDAAHSAIPPRRVLDVGTGTGTIALLAAELGHDVTGVDLSEAMLAEARAKAANAGRAIEWRIADAEALPPDLVGFDVVIARHVLWMLPHPHAAITAWRDAARPGGLVAIIDGFVRTPPPPLDAAARALGRLGSWLSSSPPADRDGAYAAAMRHQLPLAVQRDTRAVASLLEALGLERIRVRPVHEVDRVERSHQPLLVRVSDPRRRYVATGRTPILTAAG